MEPVRSAIPVDSSAISSSLMIFGETREKQLRLVLSCGRTRLSNATAPFCLIQVSSVSLNNSRGKPKHVAGLMIGRVRHPVAGSIGTPAWPAVAFVVLLVAVATPIPARAQQSHCGSNVYRPGDVLIREALGLSSLTGQVTDLGSSERAGWPLPADRPCDGPSCSRGSDPRPATPTTTSPPPIEHWACLDPNARPLEPAPSDRPVPDRPGRRDHFPIRIFHPPRPS
jgi:hypothetical protein